MNNKVIYYSPKISTRHKLRESRNLKQETSMYSDKGLHNET